MPAAIEIVTEELPPYHSTSAGKITGVLTEIVQAVLDRLGVKADGAYAAILHKWSPGP